MASVTPPSERRQNTLHRQMFSGAYDRVEPFLDPENAWSGQPLEYQAFAVLREHYPEVTDNEINDFFAAAKRVFGQGSK